MKFYIEIPNEVITDWFERLDGDKATLLKCKGRKEATDFMKGIIKEDQKYLDEIIIG